MTTFTVLEEIPRALAAKDFDRAARCLAPHVRLRALTPRTAREAASAAEAAGILAEWFGDAGELRLVEARVEPVGDRARLTYRLRGVEHGRAFLVEQTAYCTVAGGLVADVAIVCSGFRFDDAGADQPPPNEHDFDAGELGCGSGLPAEVRRRLAAIAVGDRLRIVTRDPSAREDLPALARLLGQRVLAVEPDGESTTITLERAR